MTLKEIILKLEAIDCLIAEVKKSAIENDVPFLERNLHKAQAAVQVALSSCGEPICKYDQ